MRDIAAVHKPFVLQTWTSEIEQQPGVETGCLEIAHHDYANLRQAPPHHLRERLARRTDLSLVAAVSQQQLAAMDANGTRERVGNANIMANGHIEERVAALEAEIVRLKKRLDREQTSHRPWWEEIAGGFANDPIYEQAMKLGAQYRRSLRPKPGRPRRKRDAGSRHRSS